MTPHGQPPTGVTPASLGLTGCGKRLKHRPAGTRTKVCATGYPSLTST